MTHPAFYFCGTCAKDHHRGLVCNQDFTGPKNPLLDSRVFLCHDCNDRALHLLWEDYKDKKCEHGRPVFSMDEKICSPCFDKMWQRAKPLVK